MTSAYFNQSQVGDCVTALKCFGCCPRCCLRIAGFIDETVYQRNDEELIEYVNSLTNNCVKSSDVALNNHELIKNNSEIAHDELLGSEKEAKSSVCILCLGVLQQYCEASFISQICEAVEQSHHEFDFISCGLTIPVATIVREHAVLLSLDKTLYEIIKRNQSVMPNIKEAWKAACGRRLSDRLQVPFHLQKKAFEVLVTFSHDDLPQDLHFLCDVFPRIFRKRHHRENGEVFTRASVIKALTEISHQKFQRIYPCPPRKTVSSCRCDSISCCQDPIFIGGRYMKFSRTLSQSPWVIDGERKTESSVSEMIADPLQHFFKADDTKFSASGREDVDVVMLGTGRPFAVELVNAHRIKATEEEVQKIQKEINDSTSAIAVRDLRIVSRSAMEILKQGEDEKTKTYEAICWCIRPLTQNDLEKLCSIRNLDLKQKTPIRVLHRRPVATRKRRIYTLSATSIDEHHFRIELSTQAGTYVKEFVHGDFGRTKPNMCTLLEADCDILELSVLHVELDWPPKIDS